MEHSFVSKKKWKNSTLASQQKKDMLVKRRKHVCLAYTMPLNFVFLVLGNTLLNTRTVIEMNALGETSLMWRNTEVPYSTKWRIFNNLTPQVELSSWDGINEQYVTFKGCLHRSPRCFSDYIRECCNIFEQYLVWRLKIYTLTTVAYRVRERDCKFKILHWNYIFSKVLFEL